MPIERLRGALGLSQPGAVRLVDRLQSRGLARRESALGDGRAVALLLSGAGSALREKILASRQGALSRALDSLTPSEQRLAGDLIDKMLRGALRDDAHAYEICRLCNDRVCRNCPVESAVAGQSKPA